jgi:hypothetical protein
MNFQIVTPIVTLPPLKSKKAVSCITFLREKNVITLLECNS